MRGKMTLLEDRERRLNIDLVGLKEPTEGSDPKGFLQENVPKWIPLLQGRKAHRIYSGNNNRSHPHTLISCLIRYEDRVNIPRGTRALENPPTYGRSNLAFYPATKPH
jgi:hypothetical protein